MKKPAETIYRLFARVTDLTGGTEGAENEKDESDILANQDETDSGDINDDDDSMGAGPTDELPAGLAADFARGEVDVKEQMDRNVRELEFPNRAQLPKR